MLGIFYQGVSRGWLVERHSKSVDMDPDVHRLLLKLQHVDCLAVVSYHTLFGHYFNAGRLDGSCEVDGEDVFEKYSRQHGHVHELLRARVLAKDTVGAWKGSRPHEIRIRWRGSVWMSTLPDATSSVSSTSCWRRSLVMPCFRGRSRPAHGWDHIELLSQLLNRFPCLSSKRPCAHLWGHV